MSGTTDNVWWYTILSMIKYRYGFNDSTKIVAIIVLGQINQIQDKTSFGVWIGLLFYMFLVHAVDCSNNNPLSLWHSSDQILIYIWFFRPESGHRILSHMLVYIHRTCHSKQENIYCKILYREFLTDYCKMHCKPYFYCLPWFNPNLIFNIGTI